MNVPHDANHWQILLAQAGPAALDAVLKSVLLLALAALVTGAMRRCSAAARHLVWLLAVAGLFALPGLSWTLPGWNILPRWMSVQAGVPAPAQNQSHAIAPIARDHGPHLTDRSDRTDPGSCQLRKFAVLGLVVMSKHGKTVRLGTIGHDWPGFAWADQDGGKWN